MNNKSSRSIIGIDIGGTNTDSVVLSLQPLSQEVLFTAKTTTSSDIISGIEKALATIVQKAPINAHDVCALFISSTHAINAILEAKNLHTVGIIRLAQNNPAILPGTGWNEHLKQALKLSVETVAGGYEIDGRVMAPINKQEVINATKRLLDKGAESIAIMGVFSPLYPEQERMVKDLIISRFGHIPLTCSYEMGSIGFIERENATILNSALKKCIADGFKQISDCCNAKGFSCPFYVVQNNGSTITLEQARAFPILLLAAGQTNSCNGAALLSGYRDCIIIDIGGTSTDIGLVKNGLTRRMLGNSLIAGIPLAISMPNLCSLAIGGGSIITKTPFDTHVGPESVGAALFEKAVFNGGELLTLTDIALHSGLFTELPTTSKFAISKKEALVIMEQTVQRIAHAVERFATLEKDLPLVFVGGGAALFPTPVLQKYFPQRLVVKPDHADVANAFGAACALVSGTIDETISLTEQDRVITELCERAKQKAVDNGACPKTVSIVDLAIMPYAYTAQPIARARICAAGRLKL